MHVLGSEHDEKSVMRENGMDGIQSRHHTKKCWYTSITFSHHTHGHPKDFHLHPLQSIKITHEINVNVKMDHVGTLATCNHDKSKCNLHFLSSHAAM